MRSSGACWSVPSFPRGIDLELINEIGAFIEGLKSVLNISGAVHGSIRNGISDGIADGIEKSKPKIEDIGSKVAILFISIFFLAWGVAQIVDGLFHYPGIGYAAVGILAAVVWLVMHSMEK